MKKEEGKEGRKKRREGERDDKRNPGRTESGRARMDKRGTWRGPQREEYVL